MITRLPGAYPSAISHVCLCMEIGLCGHVQFLRVQIEDKIQQFQIEQFTDTRTYSE